jgi:hypothetical protein
MRNIGFAAEIQEAGRIAGVHYLDEGVKEHLAGRRSKFARATTPYIKEHPRD